ncbi:hypothetical protein M6B38_404930 [Iris pallida]|uniref:Uncharacterized protein n=1 Tax=Iris pallida TaxID=29817 RepID=A0AAX6FRJ9_IRIPA|nr:hypothetical protein M6B38_404930 [Iris pallida]
MQQCSAARRRRAWSKLEEQGLLDDRWRSPKPGRMNHGGTGGCPDSGGGALDPTASTSSSWIRSPMAVWDSR